MKQMRVRSASALGVYALLAVLLAACGQGTRSDGESAGSATAAPVMSGLLAAPLAPTCSPTGAHAKHGAYSCATCHLCAGTMTFDPAGPSYAVGKPAPSFNATTKTCSSVGCHGIYSGTFSYDFWGDRTVTYTGNGGSTPSWYATNVGCAACHGNPPTAYPTWHGMHNGGNACEICHPNAISANDKGVGISTVSKCGPNFNQPCAPTHGNGVVDVNPIWWASCYDCH